MTCSEAGLLLDDYLDRELPPEIATQVAAHLEGCPACREEYAGSVRLKELLGSAEVPPPPETYWEEVTDLILARTVENDGVVDLQRHLGKQRQSFYRSLVSVAASLAIFFVALWFGPGLNLGAVSASRSGQDVTGAAQEVNRAGVTEELFSRMEQDRIAGGVLLVGSPGMFAGPINIPVMGSSGQ